MITNINDIRNTLAMAVDSVVDGSMTAAQANAITNASGKIISSVKLQMEYAKMAGVKPSIMFLEPTKKLK